MITTFHNPVKQKFGNTLPELSYSSTKPKEAELRSG